MDEQKMPPEEEFSGALYEDYLEEFSEEYPKSRRRRRPPPRSPLQKLWDNCGYLLVTVVVTLVLFGVVLMPAYVPTGSMEPTMPTRSFFIALRLPYLTGDPVPERGNVVVFQSVEMDEIMVKRVIGLPGETVRFSEGTVSIDGEALTEDYLPAGTFTSPDGANNSFTVPEDCVFVLGDHRSTSFDSRYWEEPFISLTQLKGRALFDISLLPGTTWQGIRSLL